MGSFTDTKIMTGLPTFTSGETNHQIGSEDFNSSIFLGSVEVCPGARTILFDGAPVDLGSRAFDVLMTLLAARGQIVSKDALMRAVWPTTTVEESNLRVQLSCLRRALGGERWRIKTIPGRGYLLVTDTEANTSQSQTRVRIAETAIVIIDVGEETIELLRRLLTTADVHVEALTSFAVSFGPEEAVALPAPPCLSGPFRLCLRHQGAPPTDVGRAAAQEGVR